jgi:CRISPR-associated DxTHG motif protein
MTRIIITFLGISASNDYYGYKYEGEISKGRVFAEALLERKLVKFDKMLVCVTNGAENTTWKIIEPFALENPTSIVHVPIEDGMNDVELWKNFNSITAEFQNDDEVIFDITHGFRSLPFLVFLFSAYLKVAKKVKIASVLYGVLEKREPPSSPEIKNIIPVIQLSSFVLMLDWMSATQQFIDLGDGNGLVKLLKGLIIRDNDLKETVQEMAEAIELVSDALIYIRPIEAMKAAAKIQQLVPQIKSAGHELAELQPFLLLVDQIDDKYKILALAEPMESQNLYQNLNRQLDMISWYQDHQQQIKSIVLARELFVSILAYWLKNDPFNSNVRVRCGSILNNKELRDAEFDRFEDRTNIWTAWISVRDPRNEYAHVGCTHDYKPIQKLKDDIDRTINQSKDCLQFFLAEAKARQLQPNSLATARPIPRPRKRNVGGL